MLKEGFVFQDFLEDDAPVTGLSSTLSSPGIWLFLDVMISAVNNRSS